MSVNESLKNLYSKFYEQKEVLTEAPQLLQDPAKDPFNFDQADAELAKLISYLMGIEDISQIPFAQAVEIVQKHYGDQPEWLELLREYLHYTLEKEKQSLSIEEEKILADISEFTDKLLQEG